MTDYETTELCYIEVRKATSWTIGHGLMLLWLKDLMIVTEKLQFIDLTFRHSCVVPSSGVEALHQGWKPVMKALDRSVETLGL